MQWQPAPTPGVPEDQPARSLSRRTLLWAVPSVALAFSGDAGFFGEASEKPLHSSTVAIGDDQRRVLVPPDRQWTDPGSRVLNSAAQRDQLRQQEVAWQSRTRMPGNPADPYVEAGRLALLDLRVLALDGGIPVAAWSPSWRYVWPRDSAFVVAALSGTGHSEEAAAILTFLQRVQKADGTFEARYEPGSGRPPDHRGVQLDGTGWSLWGLWRWSQSVPAPARAERVAEFALLLRRSAAACLRLTDLGRSLPPVSADYWELSTHRMTLANAALFLVGLQAAAKLHLILGDAAAAAVLQEAGQRYRKVIAKTFSGNGYPRYADGHAQDAAVCFLLPPFVDEVDPLVLDAWRRAPLKLRRPAGGLAPGGNWRQDGVSWTPVTALFGMTASSLGDHEQARSWLDWLLAHRTIAGSLPEKVNADGSPGSVAPLAWTSAAVVLTATSELASSAAEAALQRGQAVAPAGLSSDPR